jgi:hypothetical protein
VFDCGLVCGVAEVACPEYASAPALFHSCAAGKPAFSGFRGVTPFLGVFGPFSHGFSALVGEALNFKNPSEMLKTNH